MNEELKWKKVEGGFMACDRKASRWTKGTLLCKLSWQGLKAVLHSISQENQNFQNISDVHAMKCDQLNLFVHGSS